MDNQSNSGIFNSVVKFFGPTERLLFYCLGILMFFSGLSAIWQVNNFFLREVPARGGVFTEGVVGSPRFINPLLAISETDKGLVSLVYSGLLKRAQNGEYAPDLAEYYSISENGLVYSVKIRENAFFHDGQPVTAEDVAFTAKMALDSVLKSPPGGNWEGIGIEIIDNKNLIFTLKKPQASFLENLTQGILPARLWRDATAEEFPFSKYNILPVGSGPYKISRIKYNSGGMPEIITLKSFKKDVGGEPLIARLEIRFFQNEKDAKNAFETNNLDAIAGLSPETANDLKEKGFVIITSLMPRVFGVFFNQNQAAIFTNPEVRRALDKSIDKQILVEEVLKGFGAPLSGPIPSDLNLWKNDLTPIEGETTVTRIDIAKKILTDAGWKENNEGILEKKTKKETRVLRFVLSTSDAPELKKTAEILARTWNAMGAKVDVKVFESGDLNQSVIKPRKYEALLFGEVVGKDMDFYPFWHSSERLDPGLNIALYANITTDKLLEEIRETADIGVRTEKLAAFNNEIKKDLPVIFTYAPKFIYVIAPRIKKAIIPPVADQNDRFLDIRQWYIETDNIWNIFTK